MRHLILFTAPLFFALNAQAIEIEVNANPNFQPQKAIGIVFNESDSKYFHDVEIKLTANQDYLLAFDTEETVGDFASAIIFGENQEIAFAKVKEISKEFNDQSSLPYCEAKIDSSYASQADLLKELVHIRVQRRELYTNKVKQLLTSDVLDLLNNLEQANGYTETKPISAELSPEELNMRTFRILNGIQ